MQSAHELLDFLVSREDATPFRHPVDLNDFPVSLLVNLGCLIVKKGLKKEEVVKQEGTRLKLILCVHVCVCCQTNVLHYFNRFNDRNTSLKLN